ncbi:MAG: hypothetical protein AB8H80_15250 [Planctomycetota bacterium]
MSKRLPALQTWPRAARDVLRSAAVCAAALALTPLFGSVGAQTAPQRPTKQDPANEQPALSSSPAGSQAAGSQASGAQSAPAQAHPGGTARLCDSIEAPYAYVALTSEAAVADAGSGDDKSATGKAKTGQAKTGQANSGRAKSGSSAVLDLLTDPALDVVLAGGAIGRDAQGAPQAAGKSPMLSVVRSVLRHGASDVELVMTGIVAGGGTPLLVLRARLEHAQAERLRGSLESASGAARPSRQLGAHQTYTVPQPAGQASRKPSERVGQELEMAVVGDDFVIGNDGSAMRELLDPMVERTSAAPSRRVLSADPSFCSLRDRLEVPSGSLIVYSDWRRLSRRLQSTMAGMPAQLLGSSGLGSASSLMISVAPATVSGAGAKNAADFAATLLLGFDTSAVEHTAEQQRVIDGWFDATRPVPARELLRGLPKSGLGGLVLSVDLCEVAGRSDRSASLAWELRQAFNAFGLNFDRNLVDRLGSRGTVQLHFGADLESKDQAFSSISAVYAVRAKNRAVASDLFADLRRVVEDADMGKLHEVRAGKRRADVLELRGKGLPFSAFLAVHGDSLLLTERQETLLQVLDDLKRGRKRASRQVAIKDIKAIGGEAVAGLFDIDLEPLLQHIAVALPGVDLQSLPSRHIGYIDTVSEAESGADSGDAIVRIRLLSSH